MTTETDQSAINTSPLTTNERGSLYNNHFECDICNKEWTMESVGYETENITLCSFCKDEYIDGKESQKMERKSKSKQNEKQHKYPQFSIPENLSSHLQSAHIVEESQSLNHKHGSSKWTILRCPKCPVQFNSISQLNRHQQHWHNPLRRCVRCGACFVSADKLSLHMQLHSEEEKKKKQAEKRKLELNTKSNKCKICGGEFAKYKDVISHFKLVHHGAIVRSVPTECPQYQLKCPGCLAPFSGPSQFNNHQKHCSALTKFQCEYCDAKFSFAKNLESHMRLHIEHLSHHCPMCPKKFRLRYSLITHMRSEHKKQCRLCYLSLDSISDLKDHQRLHLKSSINKPTNDDHVVDLD